MLSHLEPSLPGFSRSNWQSTIRSYVTSHPEYSNLSSWNGRETSDITYEDHDGTLTRLLIDNGYLTSEVTDGELPNYYIEVKTTVRSCEMPFYMSRNQYRMVSINLSISNDVAITLTADQMQRYTKSNVEGRRGNEIYIIFRVFNLGGDSIGLKLLVDPESMRRRNELTFTAQTWSIVIG